MAKSMNIAGKPVGTGHPVFICAELSGNHGGVYGRAEALVNAAARAGADAVKLQLYTPDTLTLDSDAPPFRIMWQERERTLYDLYAEAATPWEWYPPLKALAESLGMACFASVFDSASVDFLATYDCPAYKIASFELVDIPLIRYAMSKHKPVILSTGMATYDEIAEAVLSVWGKGAGTRLILLKCTSAYPAPPEDANLRTIKDMARLLHCPVGLSDHTLGIAVPVAAVALGACMIEKHLTLSCADGGPDAAFSLEPAEFAAMVEAVRVAERALGMARYGPTESERANLRFRRSLFIVADVAAGEPFTAANVRSIRPAAGLLPKHLPDVLGKQAARDVKRGTPLSWDLLVC